MSDTYTFVDRFGFTHTFVRPATPLSGVNDTASKETITSDSTTNFPEISLAAHKRAVSATVESGPNLVAGDAYAFNVVFAVDLAFLKTIFGTQKFMVNTNILLSSTYFDIFYKGKLVVEPDFHIDIAYDSDGFAHVRRQGLGQDNAFDSIDDIWLLPKAAFFAEADQSKIFRPFVGGNPLVWARSYDDYFSENQDDTDTYVGLGFDIRESLFTTDDDQVDLNDLSATRRLLVLAGSDPYSALSGQDTVTLPDADSWIVTNGLYSYVANIFDAGPEDDRVTGGDLNDRIDGGEGDPAGQDVLSGGEGNDTFIGGPGRDILNGGEGVDTFDYQRRGFDSYSAGTLQTVDGGANPAVLSHVQTMGDEILLPGAPANYRYKVNLGSSWESTTTTIEVLENNSVQQTLVTKNVERVIIEDPLSNVVTGLVQGNVIAEMAEQMVEVYAESSSAAESRKWHAVSAMELGILPSNFSILASKYTFKSGIYEDVGSVLTLLNDAVAQVMTGVVAGRKTLSVAFKGSDPTDLFDWIVDVAQAREPFYEKYRPLLDGLKSYLSENAAGIDQILLTGHSLGGGMVQQFVDELTKAGYGSKIQAFTFGTIGGESETVANAAGKITNFIHVGDIANRLNGFPFSDSRGGTQVWINTLIDDFPTLATRHFKEGYEADVLALLREAGNASSPFHSSTLADAMRKGIVWKGDATWGTQIQVLPGTGAVDTILSDDEDDYVLAAGGNDRVGLDGWFNIKADGTRILDGGAGSDELVLPFSDARFSKVAKATPYGTAYDLTYSPFIGSSGLVGTLYNFEVIVYRNRPEYLDGRTAKVQTATPGQAELMVDPTADYTDAGDGAMKVVGSATPDTVYLGSGNKTVNAGAGDDIIIVKTSAGSALSAAAVLSDAPDEITLDGGSGADVMIGGTRNEKFFVDNPGDRVSDEGGIDLIKSSVSMTLPDGIETLLLIGTARTGVGNSLANKLEGTPTNNVLQGLDGSDVLIGGKGKDSLSGGTGIDRFLFASSVETAVGANRDLITDWEALDRVDFAFFDANATLAGRQGFTFRGLGSTDRTVAQGDVKYYQFGGNTYVVGNTTADTTADFQIEITGLKTLTVDNFLGLFRAVLTGSGGSDTLRGALGNDILSGLAGNDVLVGKHGKDTMIGGLGADTFRFAAAAESALGANRDVIGWDGLDTLDIALIDANSTLTGNQDFTFVGQGGASPAVTQGQIKYYQYGGNTYVVANATPDITADFQIEIIGLKTLTAANFLGLARAMLTGTGGSDTLRGTSGNDTLSGRAGNDVLIGKLGKDVLFGGFGADTFRFGSAAESAAGANRDVIRDWDVLDIIDLDPIDANTNIGGNQDFAFLGLGAVNQTVGQGQVKYYQFGGNTYVVGNTTADTTADFQIEISGLHTLAGGDFVGIL